MKNTILLITAFILSAFSASYGQNLVINGDFENTKTTGDKINCTNLQFDTLMSNVHGFGSWNGGGKKGGDLDIIQSDDYCNYAEHGKWFIAFTGGGTDAAALTLSTPIIAGHIYALSWWDEGCDFGYFGFEAGISTNDSTFGTFVYQAPKSSQGVWIHRTDTFTAPVSGAYLTIQGANGDIVSWSQLDNVSLTSLTPVVVSFNMPSSVCANQSVSVAYTGTANSSATYAWNFDGGNVLSGTGAGPYSISWAKAGTYYVTLTVTDSIGNANSATDTITVNAIPTSTFTIDTTIAAGQTDLVNYTGSASGSSVSYNWNFSNALVENTNGDSSDITWVIPGVYNVNLTVTQNGCSSASTQHVVKVTAPLTVATPVCTDSICMVSYAGFLSHATYSWSFSGANVVSGSNAGPYTLQFAAAGSYPVSVTVTIDSTNFTYTDTVVVTNSNCYKGAKDTTNEILNGNNGTTNGTDTTQLAAGINGINGKFAGVTIYPNPTMSMLNVNFKTSTPGTINLEVYDVLGRKVINNFTNVTGTENTIVLNTSELPAGSYFVRIIDDSANFSDTQQFVKVL